MIEAVTSFTRKHSSNSQMISPDSPSNLSGISYRSKGSIGSRSFSPSHHNLSQNSGNHYQNHLGLEKLKENPVIYTRKAGITTTSAAARKEHGDDCPFSLNSSRNMSNLNDSTNSFHIPDDSTNKRYTSTPRRPGSSHKLVKASSTSSSTKEFVVLRDLKKSESNQSRSHSSSNMSNVSVEHFRSSGKSPLPGAMAVQEIKEVEERKTGIPDPTSRLEDNIAKLQTTSMPAVSLGLGNRTHSNISGTSDSSIPKSKGARSRIPRPISNNSDLTKSSRTSSRCSNKFSDQ